MWEQVGLSIGFAFGIVGLFVVGYAGMKLRDALNKVTERIEAEVPDPFEFVWDELVETASFAVHAAEEEGRRMIGDMLSSDEKLDYAVAFVNDWLTLRGIVVPEGFVRGMVHGVLNQIRAELS
jgi:hypothetical protein